MPSRSIGIDPVVKILPFGLQGRDQLLYLREIHILIVRGGVDQQGSAQLRRVPGRRAAAIFLRRLSECFSEVIRRGKELLISLPANPNALFQIADRHSRVAHLVVVRMREDCHQRDEATMAPANDADTAWIDFLVLLQHPLTRVMHVLDLPSIIIYQSPKISAVTTAAPVIS